MIYGWWYRIVSVVGTATITMVSLVVANQPTVQRGVTTHIPLLWRLEPMILTGSTLLLTLVSSVIVVVGSLIPLYKPRPWRILDIVAFTQKRVFVAGLAIATLGYFNYTFRLPRTTTALLLGLLVVGLPVWFVSIRAQATENTGRTIVVGDDVAQVERIITETDLSLVGYLCPPTSYPKASAEGGGAAAADREVALADGRGGIAGLPRLGGLSKLETVLVDHDITTVCLAFHDADRGEFFGTLDLCHKHGVEAKVHREYADDVLTSSGDVETLVSVDVEPWDPQDYVFKRLFDIGFATVGLLGLAPIIVVIAIAVKLDSSGPIFYKQNRTAGFGETFPVYKFRTMVPEGESVDPVDDADNDRITRVGRLLRKTHLDEIPQLWSIFVGDMSVVGPRAAWTEEERVLEETTDAWRKRWFVKPGLTGLAQINEAKSTDPDTKLRYDIRYIRQQSFTYDLLIVIRQLWMVWIDVVGIVFGWEPDEDQNDSR